MERFWRSHGASFVPVETAVEITRQVCRGLAVAHGEEPPIIHRDIKPQNILVGYDASGLRVRVSDFGLAKRVNPLTLLASARGTLCFKAPEALRDLQSDSRAGDVWALGSTLYLLLTDRLPYPELGDPNSLDVGCFERPIIPPSRLNIQVDPALDQITFRALAFKPDERYPTGKEMLFDLEQWKPRPPGTALQAKGRDTSDMSKGALGIHSPANEDEARKMAAQAIKLARQAGSLTEAADLMEEAFNKWPEIRREYEYQVKLWRRGVVM